MSCLVITRNGEGGLWVFPTKAQARVHPIPQFCDVFATSIDELLRQYGAGVGRAIVRLAGDRLSARTKEDLAAKIPGETSVRAEVWSALVAAASKPPTDPAEIVRIVTADRKALEGSTIRSIPDPESQSASSRRTPARIEGDENDMGDKREVFRMADDGVIGFGKDEDGKSYGPDHSPKTSDATKALWAKYSEGMTVKEALDAGLSRSNIRRDRRAGFITIENPAPAAGGKTDGETSGESEAA